MSTYCISDLHGEYGRLFPLFDTINFSDSDTLYVLGDCIDRYPEGIDILLELMDMPNVQMILGNHEWMLLNDLVWHDPDGKKLWYMNGGQHTRRDLKYKRPTLKGKIFNFLLHLPDHLDIEVNGRKFHLVHGYPADNMMDRIWERPFPGAPAPIPGTCVVVGHTPTVYLNGDNGEPFKIWHGNGIVGIDCGCGNKTFLRQLACLRLDDMAEFYI